MDHDRSPVLGHPLVARAARWGIVVWAAIGILYLAQQLFRYVLFPISIIFPPLVVAMIVVYLLNPLVSGLERRGIRRIWGSLLVYLVFAAVVGTAMYFLVPVVTRQVTTFVQAAPALFGRASDAIRDVADRFGVEVSDGPAQVTSETVQGFLSRLVSITQGIVGLAIVFILGPILAFYFLVDLPKIKRALRAVLPARRRPDVEAVLERIGRAVGGFFRGQLLVALFVGVASSLALWVVGLPFWILVGLVAGLFNLIPLVGPFIGGAVAIFVAFTSDASGGLLGLAPGWRLAVGSSIALLIVQQIDNHILSPNIVGRTVRLHPVTVMLGLLVGGTLLGLFGMILAIPGIAAVKIVVLHYWDTRMTWPPAVERPVPGPGPDEEPRSPEPASEAAPAPEPVSPPRWLQGVRGLFAGRQAGGEEAPPEESVEPEPAGDPRPGSP